MNWQSIDFDWNQARAFLVTAQEGSLSAAARALGQTQPTLSRQVTALEEKLGIALFERAGRALVLTPAGHQLLEHVKAMGEAASRISLTAVGQSQEIDGHVCISASDAIACFTLPPIIKQLRKTAPGLEIEILASNTLSDLQHREADIAIRHVRPDQPNLIAKLAKESSASLYASSSYLAARGQPQSLQDLADHDFIGFDSPDRFLQMLSGSNLPVSEQNFKLNTLNGAVGWHMAQNGLGIIIMLREIAEQFPDMNEVLPDFSPFPVPFWLTTHRELHTSRRIRLVFDTLSQAFAH